jgi:RNA polymerase sigma factor (TIGR02999 family)
MGELTTLISEVRGGSEAALGRLYELLYDELHRIAHARLRHAEGLTQLQTTGLVNESYLRLVKLGQLQVDDRTHFLAYAARAMRSIVVDFARENMAQRRGAGATHVTLSTTLAESLAIDTAQVVRIHEALEELGAVDARLVQVVEMRFFAGLDEKEIAEALQVSTRTVERDWDKARAFLFDALR